MVEVIRDGEKVLATIIRRDYQSSGITFLTPEGFPLQVGHMSHAKGYVIKPHVHNPVKRETEGTYEVLFIKQGSLRVDLYSFEQEYLKSTKLGAGDFILLTGAGHGITMLEPSVIVEVKNGPYSPEQDKERFDGVKSDSLIMES